MGRYSREFEAKIANLFNKKACLYVNSGSSALYIGIEALNFPKGSEPFRVHPLLRGVQTVLTLNETVYH